ACTSLAVKRNKLMSEIDRASAILDELQTKRTQHVAKGEKLAAERSSIALVAFTKGGKERARLDEINRESALHDSELRSLDCAIAEAAERVKRAQAAEAQAANRQRAEEARKLVHETGKCFGYLDRHLTEAARALIAINDGFAQLRQAGFAVNDTQ